MIKYLLLLLVSANLFAQADYEDKRKPIRYKTTTGITESEFNSRIDADDFAIPHKKWIVTNISGASGDSIFIIIYTDSIEANLGDTIYMNDFVKFTTDQVFRFIDMAVATPEKIDTLIFLDNDDNDTSKLASIKDITNLAITPVDTNVYYDLDSAAFSATPSFDLSASNVHLMTVTSNITSASVTNLVSTGFYAQYTIILIQDGTGGHTITLGASFGTPSDESGTISTTADAINKIYVTQIGHRTEYTIGTTGN